MGKNKSFDKIKIDNGFEKTKYAIWSKIWEEELSPTWQLILSQLAQNPDYLYESSDLWRKKGSYEKADFVNLKSIFSSDNLRIRFYGDAGYLEEEALDMKVLSYFSHLRTLNIEAVVSNIEALAQCKSLKELVFWSKASFYYALYDVMPKKSTTYFIQSLKELEVLHFFGNIGHLCINLENITSLTRLKYLTLTNTLQSTIIDISPLKKLKHLTDLDISQTHVQTLQPIWDMPLERLVVSPMISEEELHNHQKYHPKTTISTF